MGKKGLEMTTHASGTFDIKSWDEKPYDEAEGVPKITRALVSTTYKGDIEGQGTLEYLMVYHDTTASYIGIERVTGQVGGRSGSFVLEHKGVYQDGKATSSSTVVVGGGAGDLAGLRGQGAYESDQTVRNYTLDYHFE